MSKKQKLLMIPSAILQYVVLGALCMVFFSPNLYDLLLEIEAPQDLYIFMNMALPIVLIGGVFLIGLLCIAATVAAIVLAVRKSWDALPIAKTVMIIKLIQIPAYVAIFALGAIFFVTVWLFVVALLFVVLDAVVILMTGGLGATAAFRGYREEKLSKSQAVVLGLLQFVYCVDVVASIVLFVKLRKAAKAEVGAQDCLAPDAQ